TKRMPVSALRLSIGFRPGKRNRRGFGGGNNGSIRFQSSSGSRGLAISDRLRMVYLYYVEDTCQVRHFVSVSKEPNDPDAPAIVNPVTIGSLGPTGVINVTGNVPT